MLAPNFCIATAAICFGSASVSESPAFSMARPTSSGGTTLTPFFDRASAICRATTGAAAADGPSVCRTPPAPMAENGATATADTPLCAFSRPG